LEPAVSRLGDAWGRIRNTKGLGRDLFVLTGLIVVGSLVGGYILTHQRISFPWDQKIAYKADFEEAPGISPGQGQEVRIAGVPVGEITKAEALKDGRARLTLSLEKRYQAVYANARAWLRSKTALNEMYVLLVPGGPPAERLKPGDVIPNAQTARPIQIDEVLRHLDERAREALGVLMVESDAALARPQAVRPALQAADGTLVALRPLMEALDTRREKIGRLVTGLADVATAAGEDDVRLAHLLDSARETLGTLAARDGDLDATLAQMPAFAAELRRTSTEVSALSGQLNPTLDGIRAASDRLPGALAGMTAVANRLDGTLDRLAPVVAGARPLVADLRPLVNASRSALADTVAWSYRLDPATANLVDHIPDLEALVYRVNSVFSLEDANGPLLRGLLVLGAGGTNPLEGVVP
jgi:phospholipid/cholesterol/gamma-HCH transport system substrate-binding protein